MGLRPLNQLAAEHHPILNLVVGDSTLMLTKLDSLVTLIGFAVHLVVAVVRERATHLVNGLRAEYTSLTHFERVTPAAIIATTRGGHKGINQAFKIHIVHEHVAVFLTSEVASTDMDVKTALTVNCAVGFVKTIAESLYACKAVARVKNRTNALNGVFAATKRAIAQELVVRVAIVVIVASIVILNTCHVKGIHHVMLVGAAHFELNTEGVTCGSCAACASGRAVHIKYETCVIHRYAELHQSLHLA